MAAAPSTNLAALERISFLLTITPSEAFFNPAAFFPFEMLSHMLTANITRSTMLSMTPVNPSRENNRRSAVDNMRKAAFKPMLFLFAMLGRHIIDIAIMSPVLAVTDPTALPIAISTLPFRAAKSDTRSSGRVVARLTMVAPIMNLGIPDISAAHVAASTKTSPPLIINPRPTINKIIVTVSSILFHLRLADYIMLSHSDNYIPLLSGKQQKTPALHRHFDFFILSVSKHISSCISAHFFPDGLPGPD